MAELTTDPNDPRLGHGIDRDKTEQHDVYLVLSEEERTKGFVRPVRTKYIHKGVSMCGRVMDDYSPDVDRSIVCALPYPHEGEHGAHTIETTVAEGNDIRLKHRRGGCGVETKMGIVLSETYASNPKFYGATYCVGCKKHLDVNEFVWSQDGEIVGS